MLGFRRSIIWSLAVVILGITATGVAAQEPTTPLDVDDAVRLALQQNYLYRQAIAGVGIAEGARLEAIAGILPTATGSYSYGKSNSTFTRKDFVLQSVVSDSNPPPGTVIERGDLDFTTDRNSTGWAVGLREDLSLTRWYNYRSAQADVSGARYNREAAAQLLAFEVRRQFYLVLRAQDLLTVQEEDLRLARDEERRINSMFELGSVARVDVLKARVRVSDADLALIQQRNAVAIERSRFATLLGLAPNSKLQLLGNLLGEAAPVDSSAASQEALVRPDILQAQETVRSANNRAKAAGWSRLPGVFATLDVSDFDGSTKQDEFSQDLFADTPNPGDITVFNRAVPTDSDFGSEDVTFRVGASLNLDALFNTGWAKRTKAIRRQAEYVLEGLELSVQQELEEAILNYRASIQAIEAAESGVESAEEDQRLSQERYQQGLGTILELLESQVALTRARNNLVNALTGLKISEAALDKARGAPLPQVEED